MNNIKLKHIRDKTKNEKELASSFWWLFAASNLAHKYYWTMVFFINLLALVLLYFAVN